jgi:2-phospho-L-lactate/phosphoenolpyruvate guanylyltransferase
MKTVLLPVKDFRYAKQRLAGVMSERSRAGLARAMLTDVLMALSQARAPERVIIYTASESVGECARQFGFDIVEEVSVQGHSAAVNKMVNECIGRASQFLSLASDLPTITPADIDLAFSAAESEINLIPSHEGTGTNAALFISPAVIQMEYGAGSLQRHLLNAARAGFHAKVLRIAGIEFDVDTPEDLRLLFGQPSMNTATLRYLTSL